MISFLACFIGLLILAAGGILVIIRFGIGAAPEDDDEA